MKRLLAFGVRFAGTVLLADALAALLVGVLCLLLDWMTTREFGSALMWAGWLMVGLAGASFGGGRQLLGNPNFWYAQSVMPKSLHERWRLNLQATDDNLPLTALLAVSGLLDAALGLWLQTL